MGTSSFPHCSFSNERIDYQLDSLPEIKSDAWNIFQKRGMHFIHLNINSLLSKIDEICLIAKPANATVIGLSELKLDDTVWSSEPQIEGYYLVRFDRSRGGGGGGVVCFVKNSISYNQKPNFCINTENIFMEVFLSKFKPVLIGVLCRPPDK